MLPLPTPQDPAESKNTMVIISALAAAFVDLSLAIAALELFSFLDPQTASDQQAPLLDSAADACLPSAAAAAGFLFIGAVAFTYHHMVSRAAAVPDAGAGNMRRRLSGPVMFVLCVSTGTLQYVLFRAGSRRLWCLAALRALPAAATAAFYWGMMLVLVAHVRAGGEGGGGGAGAVAGDGNGPVQRRVRVLTEVAVGVAAALVCMMGMAFYYGTKY